MFVGTIPTQSPVRSSKLSKALEEILRDKDALSCFIEFMESRKAGQYIRFWLDAESFQASTWSRLRSQSLNSARKSSSNIRQRDSPSEPKESPSLPTGESPRGTADKSNMEESCQSQPEDSSPSTTETKSATEEVPKEISTDSGQPGLNPHASEPSNPENVMKLKPQSLPVTPVDHGEKLLTGGSDPDCDIRDDIESRLGDTVSNSAIKRAESLKKTNLSQDELADKLKKSTSFKFVSCTFYYQRKFRLLKMFTWGIYTAIWFILIFVKNSIFVCMISSEHFSFLTGIARDAVSIFQKYLSHDASCPVRISDELRNQCMGECCVREFSSSIAKFSICASLLMDPRAQKYNKFNAPTISRIAYGSPVM